MLQQIRQSVTNWIYIMMFISLTFMGASQYYSKVFNRTWWQYRDLVRVPVVIMCIVIFSILAILANRMSSFKLWKAVIRIFPIVNVCLSVYLLYYINFVCGAKGIYTSKLIKIDVIAIVLFVLCTIRIILLMKDVE